MVIKIINERKLRAIIVEEGKTHAEVANALNISPKTFSDKLKKGVFLSNEIEGMIEFLHISDPMAVFFPDWVA